MSILLYLNRIKDVFEPETGKIAIESLALSIINYCVPVYGTTNTPLLFYTTIPFYTTLMLQKMQRTQFCCWGS